MGSSQYNKINEPAAFQPGNFWQGTLSDELDRIETLVGRVGMNSKEQSREILSRLDEVYPEIQNLENETSRKTAEGQLAGISGHLHSEAGQFVRDLGGAAALKNLRTERQPSQDQWWWYLDEYLDQRRKASLRRSLFVMGGLALALVILAVLYEAFLAPDPAVSARYGHEQLARDYLLNNDLDQALSEAEQGLTYAPQDPALLILKGVILEKQGETEEALQVMEAGEQYSATREDFLLTRGEAYSLANQPEKALADVEELLMANPDMPQAYLLAGQAYEVLGDYLKALEEYDKAFDAAEATDQSELAAIARTRTAMIMQLVRPGTNQLTAEPTAQP